MGNYAPVWFSDYVHKKPVNNTLSSLLTEDRNVQKSESSKNHFKTKKNKLPLEISKKKRKINTANHI